MEDAEKLFIESSRMFDARMFYTAISRAKKLSQIFIVEPNEELIKLQQFIKDNKGKKVELKFESNKLIDMVAVVEKVCCLFYDGIVVFLDVNSNHSMHNHQKAT